MLSVPVRFRPRPKSASVSWAAAPNDEDDAGSGVFSLRKKTFSSNFLRYTSQLHYKRALQKETESAAAISTVQAQPRAKRGEAFARAGRGTCRAGRLAVPPAAQAARPQPCVSLLLLGEGVVWRGAREGLFKADAVN